MSTNLKMTRGDTKVVQLTISGLTGTGLTGYNYWFTAKLDVADADASAIIKKVTTDFTKITNGDATTPGVLTVVINPSETASLPDYDTTLLYDAQIEDSAGHVTTVASGNLTVSPDTTRSSL